MVAAQAMLLGGAVPNFVNLTNRSVLGAAIDPNAAFAAILFDADGELYYKQNLSTIGVAGEWATQIVTGADYEIRVTLSSGTSPTGPALNTWHSLNTPREWSLSQTGVGSVSCALLVEIRLVATGVVQDSATINLQALVDA